MGTISEAPIYAKDVFGNQRDSGGDVFSASLQLLAPPYGNETIQVGDNGDGTYKAMWVVSRAGRYKLWVSGHCGAIKDAPFDVHCMPSALSFTHSLLAGEGSTDAVAGEATTFRVHGRDVFDNAVPPNHYSWAASLCSGTATYPVQQVASPNPNPNPNPDPDPDPDPDADPDPNPNPKPDPTPCGRWRARATPTRSSST